MKKIVILLVTACTVLSLTAQVEWVGDHGAWSRTSGFYKTKNGQFIIAREANDDFGFSVVDSTGNLIFSYSDPYDFNPNPLSGGQAEILEMLDFTELVDSSYLFIYAELVCYPNDFDINYIMLRFDRNWDPINLDVSVIPVIYSYDMQFLAPLPDGGFLVLSDQSDELQKRDALGGLLWSRDLPDHVTILSDFLTVSGDTTVIATRDSTYVLDGQGDIIGTHPQGFDKVMLASGGNLYAHNDDSLFLLSPTFDPLKSLGLPDIVRDFDRFDSVLAVLTFDNTIYVLDDSLNLQNSFQVGGNYPLEYIASGLQGIVAAGTTSFGGNTGRTWAPFLKGIPYDGNVVEDTEDIGVTGVEIISSPSISDPLFGDYQLVYDSLKITVQNFGNNIVDSLKLNGFFFDFGDFNNCFRLYQRPNKKYTGLSLLPGESIDLYWEDYTAVFPLAPSETFNVCIWPSLPNQKIDRDSDNDLFCIDFLVDTKESTPPVLSWTVYPNPVSNYLYIQVEPLMEGYVNYSIRITDVSGRELYVNEVSTYQQVLEVPVWEWEAGLYLVRYVSDRGLIGTSRFVVIK
ncbi:MAG: T9SS type A sorting domain-containing protein [Bacteroidota bacterium]